jgi:hypothetical protein
LGEAAIQVVKWPLIQVRFQGQSGHRDLTASCPLVTVISTGRRNTLS